MPLLKNLGRIKIAATAFISLFLLSGCVTAPRRVIHRAKTSAKEVGAVYLRLDATGPVKPSYDSDNAQDFGNSGARALGSQDPIGALLFVGARAISQSGGKSRLEKIAVQTGAFERAMVSEEVRKAMVKSGYNLQANAPHGFVIKIGHYGLHKRGFAGKTFGIVTGRLCLVENDTVVWQKAVVVMSSTGYKLAEYSEHPELYKQAIQSAAQNFANSVIFGNLQGVMNPRVPVGPGGPLGPGAPIMMPPPPIHAGPPPRLR